MSNYPQTKFTAPDISGKWNYWANIQTFNVDGTLGPITSFTGVIDINQSNLFFNYSNLEFKVARVGVLTQQSFCANGKSNLRWVAGSVDNVENYTFTYHPYCFTNNRPTKMVSYGTGAGPVSESQTLKSGVDTIYYERI